MIPKEKKRLIVKIRGENLDKVIVSPCMTSLKTFKSYKRDSDTTSGWPRRTAEIIPPTDDGEGERRRK